MKRSLAPVPTCFVSLRTYDESERHGVSHGGRYGRGHVDESRLSDGDRVVDCHGRADKSAESKEERGGLDHVELEVLFGGRVGEELVLKLKFREVVVEEQGQRRLADRTITSPSEIQALKVKKGQASRNLTIAEKEHF